MLQRKMDLAKRKSAGADPSAAKVQKPAWCLFNAKCILSIRGVLFQDLGSCGAPLFELSSLLCVIMIGLEQMLNQILEEIKTIKSDIQQLNQNQLLLSQRYKSKLTALSFIIFIIMSSFVVFNNNQLPTSVRLDADGPQHVCRVRWYRWLFNLPLKFSLLLNPLQKLCTSFLVFNTKQPQPWITPILAGACLVCSAIGANHHTEYNVARCQQLFFIYCYSVNSVVISILHR